MAMKEKKLKQAKPADSSMDLNKDGVVDKKDKSIASKVLSTKVDEATKNVGISAQPIGRLVSFTPEEFLGMKKILAISSAGIVPSDMKMLLMSLNKKFE